MDNYHIKQQPIDDSFVTHNEYLFVALCLIWLLPSEADRDRLRQSESEIMLVATSERSLWAPLGIRDSARMPQGNEGAAGSWRLRSASLHSLLSTTISPGVTLALKAECCLHYCSLRQLSRQNANSDDCELRWVTLPRQIDPQSWKVQISKSHHFLSLTVHYFPFCSILEVVFVNLLEKVSKTKIKLVKEITFCYLQSTNLSLNPICYNLAVVIHRCDTDKFFPWPVRL